MKSRFLYRSLASVVLASLLVAGCATPQGRIEKNQSYFDTLSSDAQTKIRAGKVDIGFTRQMVKLALGEPDNVYTRKTEKGTAEIWAYRDKSPSISIGFGIGGGGSGVGGGVGLSSRGERNDEKTRVVFEGDTVTAVESQAK